LAENNLLKLANAAVSTPAKPKSTSLKKRRRRDGKRSDPDWVSRTHLIRSETANRLHRAMAIVETSHDVPEYVDKSVVVDAILAQWLDTYDRDPDAALKLVC
jgi:hypothetical protein